TLFRSEIRGGLPRACILQGALAIELLPTGIEVDVHHAGGLAPGKVRIIQGRRDIDPNAAERVDDIAKRLEVDPDPVVDRLARDLRDGGGRQVAPTGRRR